MAPLKGSSISSASERITVQLQAKKIEQEVEVIRESLFGDKKAPFTSRVEADNWKREQLEWPSFKTHLLITVNMPLEEAHIYTYMPDLENITLKPQEVLDVYEASVKSKTYRRLDIMAKNLKQTLGWEYRHIIQYILTGQLPRIGTTIQIDPAGAGSVTVKFQKADIKQKGLLKIYELIRKHVGITKKKTSKDRDIELLEFFEDRCPSIWQKGTMAGYRTLQKEWNAAHKEKGFNDQNGYEGIRRALHRLADKYEIEHILPTKRRVK